MLVQCLISPGKAAVKEKKGMGIRGRALHREVVDSLLFHMRSPTVDA